MARLVVDVDDLEVAELWVLKCDGEGSAFLNFLDVVSCDRVELGKRGRLDECEDSRLVFLQV